MKLYAFQEEAVRQLNNGKKILVAGTGFGKGSVMLFWLKNTGRTKWLMTTTPSKRDSLDFQKECDAWFGESLRRNLEAFDVVSWAGLAKWASEHIKDATEYAIAYDEVHLGKSGVGSNRGRQFLKLTHQNPCWTGYTATPADNWLGFYPYFVAAGYIKNKTKFRERFCIEQHYKGYPEILGYREEDTLREWWANMSYAPDTSEIERQLPAETHKVVEFAIPTGYKTAKKTRTTADGELLESVMAYCHYLRQLCGSKAKLEWVKDFLAGLPTGCVIFYTYKEDADNLYKVAKSQRKKAKIWRIDGQTHDIPTPDTFGERDVVLAQWESGSASLNLQFINYWVSFTPSYSYSTSVQARGRIRRIGQTRPMFFYYLKCKGTIEDDIYKALKSKSDFKEENWVIRENTP